MFIGVETLSGLSNQDPLHVRVVQYFHTLQNEPFAIAVVSMTQNQIEQFASHISNGVVEQDIRDTIDSL